MRPTFLWSLAIGAFAPAWVSADQFALQSTRKALTVMSIATSARQGPSAPPFLILMTFERNFGLYRGARINTLGQIDTYGVTGNMFTAGSTKMFGTGRVFDERELADIVAIVARLPEVADGFEADPTFWSRMAHMHPWTHWIFGNAQIPDERVPVLQRINPTHELSDSIPDSQLQTLRTIIYGVAAASRTNVPVDDRLLVKILDGTSWKYLIFDRNALPDDVMLLLRMANPGKDKQLDSWLGAFVLPRRELPKRRLGY